MHADTNVVLIPIPVPGVQVIIQVIHMAEAAAAVGLVASIVSLVDLSIKVATRLHDFTSKSSDVPETFRSLANRLPLLTATLQRIQSQAEAGHLPEDLTRALNAVVDHTFEQIATVQTSLSKILPSDGASKLERAVKALKSLAKEDTIQQASEKIYKNSDTLVLYQTTRNVDAVDCIWETLSKPSITPPMSYLMPLSEIMLTIVCSCQRRYPSLVPVPRYRFGKIMTLSIATRLLKYTHGVLSRLLEWHWLVWEASGNYKPTRQVKMHTERIKEVTAGNRVCLPSPRQFTGHMGVLGPREQQGKDRGGIPENCRSDPTPWAGRSESQHSAACPRLAVRRVEWQMGDYCR